MRSDIDTVRLVLLEVIISCVLLSSIKNIEYFWGVIWLLSRNVLQLVLKDDVSDVVVIFDEDILLELRWIFDSITSDGLSCKRCMEVTIFCEY